MSKNPSINLRFFCAILLAGMISGYARAQEAGLARTPPMGWNSWNAFHLKITDKIIREQADALVRSGMKAAEYQYVVIDGGWEGYHDAQGVFHPDARKFPDMKALCEYIHGLGLKVGIHTTPGPMTCGGREGSYGYEDQDARTFARWGIDFVKYDWCSAGMEYKPDQMRAAYEKFHQALLRTGRPILYSLCQYGMEDVWKWGRSVGGNMWRTTGDISDDYYRIAYIGFEQEGLEKYAGPGHWNDPDMLEVGNGHLSKDEEQTQMSLWCLLAAPLFASNDLTQMSPGVLSILTNREVIAVDQDPAGIQGRRVWQEGPMEIWVKPLADGSKAVGLFNREDHPMTMTLYLHDVGISGVARARDLWTHEAIGVLHGSYSTTVPRHGVVLLKVQGMER